MKENIDKIKSLNLENYGHDFLLTWNKTPDELEATLLMAELLKERHRQGKPNLVFDSGLAVSIFRDNSTRTRFSFASAANALGLAVSDMDEEKSQVSHGETVRETANMISFMTRVIGIRDDMYLGEGHSYMKEVSAAVQAGFEEGVLHNRPGLINLQCDIDHPTQSMSDLAMLKNYFGSLDNLKGKKIAMSWAYSPSYGKPLSVPQGIIGLLTRYGMDVTLAHPEGYSLIPEVVKLADKQAQVSSGSFQITNSMDEAFSGADIVYPKSWAPFDVMEERTTLLKQGDQAGLKGLEKSCLTNNAKFTDWECTEDKMKLTKGGEALYMHCLPADITGVSCEQGEVSASVFDKYRRDTYLEASYKPFIIAAMMFLTSQKHPLSALDKLA
ncbi:MAG: knotted carbamoyltransferase YgeW [Candidatus Marinimicrobia bacterium]|jgi:knotted carbamoyltransferase YgeW|nr:knotted carbamoyltransferase YgeW [Candidatus Neomarinimicrobiota bacterium]MBT3577073.1 knotted carbamoyltransferase YgeW [Candidatus Neomarinimicrobiota bacterium]MBT3679955.1 knotted carbamoyltransferase YgeW [Candidatus Neomarinimicrobiota bacterium]MBT3949650.1 knotted carbamoyltransferase YgeW [Candidatus Neomarinimicrobiota bacterium]MBT4253199.1 knotted carbamoyltransferase YgeW [Candidatus Neomarinimicrobiota bacterium]